MSGGLQYYPIYSGGKTQSFASASWAVNESADFTDQNTNVAVPTGKRFQCITVKNLSSTNLVLTFGTTTAIVSATAASSGYPVAAGETRRIEVFSLGGSVGVKAVGVRIDPVLELAKVGPVLFGDAYIYAEFGNQ